MMQHLLYASLLASLWPQLCISQAVTGEVTIPSTALNRTAQATSNAPSHATASVPVVIPTIIAHVTSMGLSTTASLSASNSTLHTTFSHASLTTSISPARRSKPDTPILINNCQVWSRTTTDTALSARHRHGHFAAPTCDHACICHSWCRTHSLGSSLDIGWHGISQV